MYEKRQDAPKECVCCNLIENTMACVSYCKNLFCHAFSRGSVRLATPFIIDVYCSNGWIRRRGSIVYLACLQNLTLTEK